MPNGYEIYKYCNTYGVVSEKRADVYLEKYALEGLALVSYSEVLQERLSEIFLVTQLR